MAPPPGGPAAADGAGKRIVKHGETRDQLQREIAALAARLMAEDGHDSAQARHKAAAQILGGGARSHGALPDHAQVETALRAYLRLHQGAAHGARLQQLRGVALAWMRILAPFQPHLVGPVLNGCATEHSAVQLHLYTDSAKDVEMALLDRGMDIRVAPPDHAQGPVQEVIGFVATAAGARGTAPGNAGTAILLTVFDRAALRIAVSAHARREDPELHPVERSGRANLAMVMELLAASDGPAAQAETLHV